MVFEPYISRSLKCKILARFREIWNMTCLCVCVCICLQADIIIVRIGCTVVRSNKRYENKPNINLTRSRSYAICYIPHYVVCTGCYYWHSRINFGFCYPDAVLATNMNRMLFDKSTASLYDITRAVHTGVSNTGDKGIDGILG